MCGIAVIIEEAARPSVLMHMLKTMRSRGDEEHFGEALTLPGCCMGTNRLAIVARHHARQPFSSSDNRFHLVFNGEIYNHQELRDELIHQGVVFSGLSDTEVILKGYQAWGADIVKRLEGMFAFVIYDLLNNDFFAARDPFGIKPLYFAKTNSSYFFASEIKALAGLDFISSISLFYPGTTMTRKGFIPYYSFSDEVGHYSQESQVIDKLRLLFNGSVKSQTATDLPIGVFLSGGIDSSAVLATARQYHQDVTAIITGNHLSQDRLIAERYCLENKIPHFTLNAPDEESLSDLIPELVRICETFEPNVIRQSALSLLLAREAYKMGLKVVLCGEGADELFAGYPELNIDDSVILQRRLVNFVADLHRTQLQRVDRTSMAASIEVRVPFLDSEFGSFALGLHPRFKRNPGCLLGKTIFRQAMKDRLPEYIVNRPKVVFSEGAGLSGNDRGGLFSKTGERLISDDTFERVSREYQEWNLGNKEEVYYFLLYKSYGYHKATFNQKRVVVNHTATIGSTDYQRSYIKDVQHLGV